MPRRDVEMADSDEGFLRRWSRLKRGGNREVPEPQGELQPPVEPPREPADATEPPEGAPAEPVADADLPPIETLDRNSDYTVFMRAGVAPELRNQALRKLWRSDPVFANLDGLLEYGEDFSEPFKRGGVVSTLYRVGKGMMSADEASVEKAEPSDEAAATSSEEASPAATDPSNGHRDEEARDIAAAKTPATEEDGTT